MKVLSLAFLLSAFVSFHPGTPARAQETTVLTLIPESRLWVEGTSNKKKNWRAVAPEMAGTVTLVDKADAPPEILSGSLTISAEKITGDVATGKFIMNRLIHEALKVKEHPQITYTLDSAAVVADGEPFELRTNGTLTLTGVSRPIAMTLTGERTDDGGLRITGSYALTMTDYGIKPPSIRTLGYHVGKEVDVHFDLLFAP